MLPAGFQSVVVRHHKDSERKTQIRIQVVCGRQQSGYHSHQVRYENEQTETCNQREAVLRLLVP